MKTAKITAALAFGLALLFASPASAAFSIADFSVSSSTSVAGGHPDLTTNLILSTRPTGPETALPDGNVKTTSVELPPGFVGDVTAIPPCLQIEFVQSACPPDTQVGIVELTLITDGGFRADITAPVLNMEPRSIDETAELGFSLAGIVTVHLPISVRSDGDYGLTVVNAGVQRNYGIGRVAVTVWGVPGDPSHDALRTDMNLNPLPPTQLPRVPFFTNPTRCDSPLGFAATATSYQDETPVGAAASLPKLSDCDGLAFEPSLRARPTTDAADSPSGLDVDLRLPQNDNPEGRATAELRDAVVSLPEGLVVNPSSANGLDACSPGQIGLSTAVGDPSAHFDREKPTCPAAASLGSVEVDTPVFDDPLKGSVYLASPDQNPFGSLLALYLVIEGHGLVIKLAGKVQTDPNTGRVTTSFTENPQLPVEDLRLRLFSGDVAPLRTPATCGTYATTSSLTPWSAPQSGPPANPKDEYAITRAPGGGGCASGEASLPKSAGFDAGTASAVAGKYTPFVLKLSRDDGTQQLTGIDATLPPGLLAKLAGVPYCADADLAAAAGKSGKVEQLSPSCPGDSQVGTLTVAAGAGPKPFYAAGKAYLAGPYKGAALSLAIVVPAVAGPFDLGTVVVRNALYVDPTTAQVHAVSDPFPTILQGIPLDLRSVDLELSKAEFTKNPTSCDPAAISGAALLLTGQSSPLSAHFQVGECANLAFRPSLKLSLNGQTKRTGNPAVRAVLTQPAGQANIAATTVVLPRSEFIDQSHINNPCTRVQFGQGACPAKSVLGTATAWSPLLGQPLTGPVYFRSNGGERKLPDIVADLSGQIHVVLVGFVDSVKVGKEGSRVRTRFLAVPDAPVSRFELKLKGGKRGLIENSKDLCQVQSLADVGMTGQNGATDNSKVRIATSCKKKSSKQGEPGRNGREAS